MASRKFKNGLQATRQADMIYRRYGENEGVCRNLIIQGELALHMGEYDTTKILLADHLVEQVD